MGSYFVSLLEHGDQSIRQGACRALGRIKVRLYLNDICLKLDNFEKEENCIYGTEMSIYHSLQQNIVLTGECPNVKVCYKQKMTFSTRNLTTSARNCQISALFEPEIPKNVWAFPS